MRTGTARTTLLSATALVPALLWGLVEVVALQWSFLRDRLRIFTAQRPA